MSQTRGEWLNTQADERARQRVEADLGEGDDPSTQQILIMAEPDAAAAAVMPSLLL